MGCEDRRYESAEDTAERERWNADNDGSTAAERARVLAHRPLTSEEFRAVNKRLEQQTEPTFRTFQEKPFYRVHLTPVEMGIPWKWEVFYHSSHAPGKWTKKSVNVGFSGTEFDAENAARRAVNRAKQAGAPPRTFDIS